MRRRHYRSRVLLLLLFSLERNKCVTALEGKWDPGLKIISTQKNGGHEQIFSLEQLNDEFDNREAGRKRLQFSSVPTVVKGVKSAVRSTFLPNGFPAKTPKGYLRYSVWSWCQDLSTQLRSVLATQRVLEGVGVGRTGATALSALMNYLVRDGCGMAATLLFTSIASSRFRTDVKRWRLFADIMVDIGITLEVLSTSSFVPHSLFLPLISLGTCCKAICGVAAGSCGGAINLHWARGSDISDINAKFGAQHTVTGAIGLLFSAYFAKSVAHVKQIHLWTLYTALTLLHLFANTRCMRLLAFDSLNTVRMNLILREFFDHRERKLESDAATTITNQSTDNSYSLSTPSVIAMREPLLFGMPLATSGLLSKNVAIYFGDSFANYCKRKRSRQILEDVKRVQSSFRTTMAANSYSAENDSNETYLISGGWTKPWRRSRPCVTVVFGPNASPADEARAFLHAHMLARRLHEIWVADGADLTEEMETKMKDAEQQSQTELHEAWGIFQRSCFNGGWDLSRTELQTLGYEVHFA